MYLEKQTAAALSAAAAVLRTLISPA